MTLRSALGRMTLVVVLAAAVVVGWLLWPSVSARVQAGRGGDGVPPAGVSPALAEATLDRVENLRSDSAGQTLALGDAELSSVVRYAMPGLLPPGVIDPEVQVREGEVALSARIASAAFPDLPALDPVAGLLPDTVPVRIEGALARFGKESLAFQVRHIEVAAIPLPDRMIPDILKALGRRHRDGLPTNALHLPLPGGLDSVYVRADSLMLVADR